MKLEEQEELERIKLKRALIEIENTETYEQEGDISEILKQIEEMEKRERK